MSDRENTEIYRRITQEGFVEGDTIVIDELLSDDFVEHEAVPGSRPGRDGVKDTVAMVRTGFPDLRITINDTFSAGDQLCARSTWTGTNTGPFMGKPATGRTATWEAIDIVRVRDGHCTEHWGQLDMMSLLTQLGALDMPAAA